MNFIPRSIEGGIIVKTGGALIGVLALSSCSNSLIDSLSAADRFAIDYAGMGVLDGNKSRFGQDCLKGTQYDPSRGSRVVPGGNYITVTPSNDDSEASILSLTGLGNFDEYLQPADEQTELKLYHYGCDPDKQKD